VSVYELLYRTVICRFEAERAHHLGMAMIRAVPFVGGALWGRLLQPKPDQAVRAFGVDFPSPIGLAAGFDKDARAVVGLGQLGFGHVEIGTVTAHAQPGNPKPRLFRLAADRAFINRMGFNNQGAEAAARRLERLRRRKRRPVIGVNIGKSRIVEVEHAVEDYLTSTRLLAPLADYLVVNVSSPNTPGLRGLQELDMLEPLLTAVRDAAGTTPLLVKIAPDLDDEQVRGIAALATRVGLAGVIATNTTLSREGLQSDPSLIGEAGGLSGAPVARRSLEILKVLRAELPAETAVISVGGVETAAQAQERLDAGATLVQAYTGFIYRGPFWAHQVTKGLRRLSA